MEFPDIELGGAVIHNADDAVRRFVDEWNNDSPHVVAHTSGSTGTPKEIRLLKSDMVRSASATCTKFGIGRGSVMVLPLSADYIAGKMMIVRAMVSQAHLWIESPSNRPLIRDYGMIDLLPVVPSQLEWLLEDTSLLSSVRNLIVGGGAISSDLEMRLSRSGVNAYASYGMTETCSHVALRRIGDDSATYEALPGIEFDVDERGCLIVNADGFSFGSLVTNDMVHLVDRYRFRWKGRWDNVINTGGIKLFPEAVEQRISSSMTLPPFYLVGRPSEKWGEEVVMYIESGSKKMNVSDIVSCLRKILNRYEMPKEIITVSNFERTASGKVKRVLI